MKLTRWYLSVVLVIFAFFFTQCSLVKPTPESMNYEQTDEDYTEILEKHIEAVGGKENIAKIENIYYRYDFKGMGMEGTTENWYQGDSLYRYEDRFGKEIDIDIVNNNKSWEIKPNGIIYEDTVKSISGDRLFFSFQYIYPETNNAKYVRGKQVNEDGRDLVPIIITPENDSSIVLLIDPKTYLVYKIKRLDEGIVLSTTLSDYREVEGVKIPYKLKSIYGVSLFKFTEILKNVKINQTYPDSLFLPPENIAKKYEFKNNVGYAEIPFEFIQDKILLLKASINNNPSEYFLLDTGASSTFIDLGYIKSLGLSTKGKIPILGASIETEMVDLDLFSLPGLNIKNITLNAMEFPKEIQLSDKRIVGILGGDILSMFVFNINFDKKLITLYDKEKFEYKGNGEILDISIASNTPIIKACLNDTICGNFAIDMGYAGRLLLIGEILHKCNLIEHKDNFVKTEALGAGGKVDLYNTRIGKMKIGSFLIEDIPIGFVTETPTGFISIVDAAEEKSPKTDGNIGSQLLSRFNIYLDYQGKKIILEKNSNFGKPFVIDKSGMIVIKKENKFIIKQVIENTPASEVGLKEKDELIKINGKPASNYTLSEITKLLKGNAGERIDLVIKRGRKKMEFSLILREYIK
ncbi:MAG: hypothetical protein PWQ09_1423 [Candidatus Cloacimonadota bacterium]|jgi:hypothetical protein|nr:hypothetical protein [Candidatus Cloacimonadota bacterium]